MSETKVAPPRFTDGAYILPFLAPGPPDRGRLMQLVVTAYLPEGSGAWLEAPAAFINALNERSPFVTWNDEGQVGLIPVNPHGRRALGPGMFEPRSRTMLRLLVQVPAEFQRYAYEVAVSQRYLGHEIGRITWRLGPRGGPSRSAAER